MYTLRDTFNDYVISRHRTLLNAVRAKRKHSRAVERRNGPGSYVTYAIRDGDDAVEYNDLMNAEWTLDFNA